MRDGFNAELDRLRHIRRHGREEILQIQEREREKTGIKSLKVGYNKVFGYYIEVSALTVSGTWALHPSKLWPMRALYHTGTQRF